MIKAIIIRAHIRAVTFEIEQLQRWHPPAGPVTSVAGADEALPSIFLCQNFSFMLFLNG